MFERIQNVCEKTMDKLFVQMNRPPESERGRQDFIVTINKNEFARWGKIRHWIENNKTQLGLFTAGALISIGTTIVTIVYTTRKTVETTSVDIDHLARKILKNLKKPSAPPPPKKEIPNVKPKKEITPDPPEEPPDPSGSKLKKQDVKHPESWFRWILRKIFEFVFTWVLIPIGRIVLEYVLKPIVYVVVEYVYPVSGTILKKSASVAGIVLVEGLKLFAQFLYMIASYIIPVLLFIFGYVFIWRN